jgi:hypothetical protein
MSVVAACRGGRFAAWPGRWSASAQQETSRSAAVEECPALPEGEAVQVAEGHAVPEIERRVPAVGTPVAGILRRARTAAVCVPGVVNDVSPRITEQHVQAMAFLHSQLKRAVIIETIGNRPGDIGEIRSDAEIGAPAGSRRGPGNGLVQIERRIQPAAQISHVAGLQQHLPRSALVFDGEDVSAAGRRTLSRAMPADVHSGVDSNLTA